MNETTSAMTTKKIRTARSALTPERQDLAVRYLPLARTLARPFKEAWKRSRDEFDSAAGMALVEAAESFDPGRNVNFATFARHRINGALCDLRRELIDHQQRFLTNTPSSGTVLVGDGCSTSRGRLLGIEPEGPVGYELERRELVEVWLSKLPRKHAFTCRQTYFHDKTQTEIAHSMGYSQSRMSTMHQEALRYLRDISDSAGFEGCAA